MIIWQVLQHIPVTTIALWWLRLVIKDIRPAFVTWPTSGWQDSKLP